MRDGGWVLVFLIGLVLAVIIGLSFAIRTYHLPDLTRVTHSAMVRVLVSPLGSHET